MNRRSDLNSSGSNKICEVYMYVINCMGGSLIVGKKIGGWGQKPKEPFIAKWADLHQYILTNV